VTGRYAVVPTSGGIRTSSSFYDLVMARMTPEEANAVNVVASYLAGVHQTIPDEVARAMETLASRAHNRIQTGWDEGAVRKQWPTAFSGS
jgi:hypothetical protein